MASAVEATQALEQASQKHEKELVLEFGPDRILHYVGVYLVAFLAVVAKVSELAASNLSCHPAGNGSTDGNFIAYASTYCWESLKVANPNPSETDACKIENSTSYEKELLQDPSFFKAFIQMLPYAMIVEAILFAIPTITWHVRVGARLMGHIKFMKLLLNDIYETVKPIQTGVYRSNTSYDKCSYYLDGWRGFEPDYKKEEKAVEAPKSSLTGCLRKRVTKTKHALGSAEDGKTDAAIPLQQTSNDGASTSTQQDTNKDATKDRFLTRIIFGGMRDRHLFSMLCFENFSSLEHHPYILSVYKLTDVPKESPDRGFIGSKTKGILRLVCNRNNFSGRFLVKSYFLKHFVGVLVAVILLITTGLVLYRIGLDGWNAESFRCNIIYHMDVCMICTIRRRPDMIAYMIVNIFINVLYLNLSVIQLIFIRRSSNRATCHYFEEISDCGSVALNRAS